MRSKVTGIPDPEKYDKYYITKYSFPKGLWAVKTGPKPRHIHMENPKYSQNDLVKMSRKHKRNNTM